MFYVERPPHPALAPFIKTLWYCRASTSVSRRQIVLPTGHLQIVISLARDHLTDCFGDLYAPSRPQSPAILAGIYSRYMVIDSIDLTDLIGVVFQPGGTIPFFSTCTQLFTNQETSVEDIWGFSIRALRDRLCDAKTPEAKFACLNDELLCRFRQSRITRNQAVDFALEQIHTAPSTTTVAELTRSVGLSPRRVSQLFQEHVGVSPKLYCRIRRFQQAVRMLHRGDDIPWAEIALACGYYDQSHFVNDFRAFSGITPTTYTAAQRPWANHIAAS